MLCSQNKQWLKLSLSHLHAYTPGTPTAHSPLALPLSPRIPCRHLTHPAITWVAGPAGLGWWVWCLGAREEFQAAPSAPLANVKCLQTEKNHPERLFRLEINVTEKCGSRAINAAFFATHYVSALKREGAHFWRVFNLLGLE